VEELLTMHRGQTVRTVVVIRRPSDGALLVSEQAGRHEPLYHRLLGGHVEFGEYALAAAHRELAEEIGQRLTGVRLLGVLENIFGYADFTSHQVIFVYAAALADPAAYDVTEQRILDEPGSPARVIWRPADAVTPPLYPLGLDQLFEESGA
jgi:ADP-ribose pyrophosphatase YjhB (NUDIX family)